MLKRIAGMMLAGILLLSMAACGQPAQNNEASQSQTQSEQITDSKGRVLSMDKPAEKIVVLNADALAMVQMLGKGDKVIGVSDSMIKTIPEVKDKQSVGAWNDPSIEKIIELSPDLVIGYSKYLKDENVKQLENAGITVAMFDFYNSAEVAREIDQMGKLLGNETKAKEYTEFVNKYLTLIQQRTADLNDTDKATVYWEGYTDYKSAGKGTGGDELVKAAGCVNITGNENTEYPVISDEWIIEENPELIVKATSSTKFILGQGIKDDTTAQQMYKELTGRTGWNNLDAVKNRKTILIDSEITLSPQGSIIGSLYIAKLAYPEKFKDIDPLKIHSEMQEKFFNTKADGIFVYPQNNQ